MREHVAQSLLRTSVEQRSNRPRQWFLQIGGVEGCRDVAQLGAGNEVGERRREPDLSEIRGIDLDQQRTQRLDAGAHAGRRSLELRRGLGRHVRLPCRAGERI